MVMCQDYLKRLIFVVLNYTEIFNYFQVLKAIIKFFHDNEHALMQTEHHEGKENRETGYGL